MFCSYCGKKIADQSKFCPECGASLDVADSTIERQSPAPTQAGKKERISESDKKNVELFLIVAIAICGLGTIISLIPGPWGFTIVNVIALVINGGITLAVFLGCFQKFRQNDLATAKTASIGLGITLGVLGFISLFSNPIPGLLGLAAGAALIVPYTKLP